MWYAVGEWIQQQMTDTDADISLWLGAEAWVCAPAFALQRSQGQFSDDET